MKQEDKLLDVFQDIEKLYYNIIARLIKLNITNPSYQTLFKELYKAVINIMNNDNLDRETKTITIMDIGLTMKKEMSNIEDNENKLSEQQEIEYERQMKKYEMKEDLENDK